MPDHGSPIRSTGVQVVDKKLLLHRTYRFSVFLTDPKFIGLEKIWMAGCEDSAIFLAAPVRKAIRAMAADPLEASHTIKLQCLACKTDIRVHIVQTGDQAVVHLATWQRLGGRHYLQERPEVQGMFKYGPSWIPAFTSPTFLKLELMYNRGDCWWRAPCKQIVRSPNSKASLTLRVKRTRPSWVREWAGSMHAKNIWSAISSGLATSASMGTCSGRGARLRYDAW